MKKILMILLVAALCFGVVGCGETAEKDTAETKVEEKNEQSAVATEKEDEKEEEDTTEAIETKDEVAKEDEEEEEKIAVLEVDGLSGLELLAAIKVNMPESAISTTESVAADGTMSTSLLYTKGENMRTETNSADMGEQVMIYNAELGEMYVYSVAEKSGIISVDDEEEDDDTDYDTEGDMTYAELMVGEDPSTFEAKVEELNGEQVIYIHTSSKDEGMSMDIHTWYSIEYLVAMKTEMYINGALAGSSVVTEIQVNVDIDDSLFDRPEGITLVETLF